MKARYVAGMLDGTLQLSVSPDNQVRARLITTTRGVYDALSAVLGGDEFKRVVISKRVTLSTGADGSAKVSPPSHGLSVPALPCPALRCPPPPRSLP